MLAKYRVTGRYMAGNEIVAYHVVDANGNGGPIQREQILVMTARGEIENLRVQNSGDNVIIRGKGINLNNLPVFDIKNQKFRNGIENGLDNKPVKSVSNTLSQYTITKRLMHKTTCVGYVVQDRSGKEVKLSRQNIIKLASNGLISNATVNKYTPNGSKETRIIVRGVGCDLSKLPYIMIDINGEECGSNNETLIRATMTNRSGIIHNESSGQSIRFESGDYILCTQNCGFKVIRGQSARQMIKLSESKQAMCDANINNTKNYTIEFIGSSKRRLSPEIISKWPVVKLIG